MGVGVSRDWGEQSVCHWDPGNSGKHNSTPGTITGKAKEPGKRRAKNDRRRQHQKVDGTKSTSDAH